MGYRRWILGTVAVVVLFELMYKIVHVLGTLDSTKMSSILLLVKALRENDDGHRRRTI